MEMGGEILGQLLTACVGTAAFSALFGVPKKYWLDCGICGAVGWGVYLAVMAAYQMPIIGAIPEPIKLHREQGLSSIPVFSPYAYPVYISYTF